MDCERVANDMPSPRAVVTRSVLILLGTLSLVWPVFAAYGYWLDANSGVLASLAALGIAAVAAGASLVIAATFHSLGQPISGVLGGMLVRMILPLAALLAISNLGEQVRETGVRQMILGYYLVALAMESWLLVRFVPVPKSGAAKAA